jgi:hypothetical protein
MKFKESDFGATKKVCDGLGLFLIFLGRRIVFIVVTHWIPFPFGPVALTDLSRTMPFPARSIKR